MIPGGVLVFLRKLKLSELIVCVSVGEKNCRIVAVTSSKNNFEIYQALVFLRNK